MSPPTRVVLFLDDDEDLRDTTQQALELFGTTTVIAGSLEELRDAREKVMKCTLAILDINLGPGSESGGLDACRWLREEGFAGDIVFLTGHGAADPRVAAAKEIAGTRLFSKPITLDALKRIVTTGT